jgi:signal transduction histidine kinase
MSLYKKTILVAVLALVVTTFLTFIATQGQRNLTYFLVAVSVVSTTAGALLLERSLLKRVAELSAVVTRIRATDDLKIPINVVGHDEIAILAAGTQAMLDSLALSRARLEAANRELEQRVAQGAADLAEMNTRLREEIADRQQAQTMLAETRNTLRVKSQIVANVGHDARTPLTAINLRTEMLQFGKYGPVNEKQQEVLENILISSQQLMGCINNMLSEAQFTNGKVTLARKPFKPPQLVNELVQVLGPLAERKQLVLRAELDALLPEKLVGDPDRLKQIITNLVDNAIKFTTSGGVTIKVVKIDSLYWEIRVTDTGRGMSAEALQHIFDPFWQVNGSMIREVNHGVGLGLSIVKQLVELMGGQIQTDSKVGAGTTFTVTLPYEEYHAESADEAVRDPSH